MPDHNTPPIVDGAPLNPYDLPGKPRGDDDATPTAPTSEESAAVPGPGGGPDDPIVTSPAAPDDTDDESPHRRHRA